MLGQLTAAVVLGVGMAMVRGRRSRRRRADLPAVAVALPELDAEDLRPRAGEQPATLVDRLLPYAQRQVPGDGWERRTRPAGVRGALGPARVGLALRGPALALVLVLCAGSWWAARWAVLEAGPTATAPAVSTGEVTLDGPGPLPDDVAVRYRGPTGALRQVDLATARELPPGATVRIEYSLAHPGEARLVGDRTLGRAAAVTGFGLLLLGGWTSRRVAVVVRHTAGVAHARRERPRPALGLLTADSDGGPLVLVCDPLVSPVQFLAVPVETPLPTGTAAALAGDPQVAVHGRLAAGRLVTLEPAGGGGTLFPAAPALPLHPELMAAVLASTAAPARTREAPQD